MTKLEQYRKIIEDALDRGYPCPTNRAIAMAMGRDNQSTRDYGLGGRYTYEKQKIMVERGIATPAQLAAFAAKDGTYDAGSVGLQQRQIVADLKQRGEFFRR